MPSIPNFLELFLILVVYFGKITEEKEFNENLSSAKWMKLLHECNVLHCSTARYKASAKILRYPPCPFAHPHENKPVDWPWKFSFLSDCYRFVSHRTRNSFIYFFYRFIKPSYIFKILFILAFPLPLSPSNCFPINMCEFCRFSAE